MDWNSSYLWRSLCSLIVVVTFQYNDVLAAPSPSMQKAKPMGRLVKAPENPKKGRTYTGMGVLRVQREELARGFQVGVSAGAPIVIRNKRTRYKVESEMLTGFELNWVHIKKDSPEKSIREKLGIILHLSFMSGELNEGSQVSSEDFLMGRLMAAATFTFYPQAYGYLGLHLPSLGFGLQAVGLEFSGQISPTIGAGYQFHKDWSVDLAIGQNRYEIREEISYESLGTLSIPTTKLSLNYTF